MKIAYHFGEDWDPTDCAEMCDNCKNSNSNIKQVNVSEVAHAAIQILEKAQISKTKLTALKLIGKVVLRKEQFFIQ